MHVIQIVASIEDEAAGPSYSAPRLSAAVARAGAEVALFSIGARPRDIGDGVAHQVFPQSLAGAPVVSQLRLSSAMRAALRQGALRADVLHAHGLWLAPNIYPADAARAAGKALVISPRGMLGGPALAFSPVKKKLMWALAQGRAARSAALLHATSDQELEDIRAAGLTNPVAVIPNGIDVPPLDRPGPEAVRTVLSLGRIHPKKGLDSLLRAWSRLGPAAEGWRLRIVGPDEGGHAGELKALAQALNLTNVAIEGPVFGDAKLAAYRAADLFVLSTLNENFAMTVAEALAAGVPVISTTGAPWAGLETEGCGWWVETGEASLAAAMAEAMARPAAELAAMGEKGWGWMRRDFSWDRIGREMLDAYRWVSAGGDPPPTVRL
ncbi:MAG TPA: glycosyltransferase [Caulobacter sp.]|nr:glycosyltransferase [Caulobacter sp.]